MKTMVLELLKKNRVYFKIKLESGHEAKLKITSASENLELGKHTLLVNDVSVRSKYGTDLIFDVVSEVKKDGGIITLKTHSYNKILVDACRNLGGRWDKEEKVWVFPDYVAKEVEELDYVYNSTLVTIELTAMREVTEWRDTVDFLGYPLARASGRDSGAKLCENICKINGLVTSGGSSNNWLTVVEEGTIFVLQVPQVLLDKKRWNLAEWSVQVRASDSRFLI